MRAWLAVTLLTVSACQDPNEPLFEAARQAAAAELAYPSTAEFRNLRLGLTDLVCGEMNGRDLDGKETGFRRFSWMRGGQVQLQGDVVLTGDREADLGAARLNDSLVSTGCEEP